MRDRARKRLTELDALRGIAAASVLLFHYFNVYPHFFPEGQALPPVFAHGGHGVLLFFAVSGFVITFSLEGTRSAAEFAVKRFARLYPLYWASMVMSIGLVVILGGERLLPPAWAIPVNLTMVQGFFFVPAVDGVYWTLEVELAFYVCMLCIWKTQGFARLEPILGAWLAIKAVTAGWLDMPSRLAMLMVLEYIPFFIIGMLFCRIWSKHRSWLQQVPYLVMAQATILWADPLSYALGGIWIMAIFAAMLRGWLPFLRIRPFLWLGGMSYALYLLHHNIGMAIMHSFDQMGLSPWLGLCAAIGSILLLAAMLTYGIERPAARWINRWGHERTKVNTASIIITE